MNAVVTAFWSDVPSAFWSIGSNFRSEPSALTNDQIGAAMAVPLPSSGAIR